MTTPNKDKALFIGFGNPGRQDDGLGPTFIAQLEASQPASAYELTFKTNYQLTVEDAYDLQAYSLVVFVDASIEAAPPFSFSKVKACDSQPLGSHSIQPEALLQLCSTLYNHSPEAYVLAIRGYEFNRFEEHLSDSAASHSEEAHQFVCRWLKNHASCDHANDSERINRSRHARA